MLNDELEILNKDIISFTLFKGQVSTGRHAETALFYRYMYTQVYERGQ